MYYYILPTNKDIQHHGVLGMKWGVRRYQSYSVIPRGSGKGGKEIGDAKRSASSHEIKKYAKKLGKTNAKINYYLMKQNQNLAVTEKVGQSILKNKNPDINSFANDRYIASLRNIWFSSDQYNQEVKFDKIIDEIHENFDKKSIESIDKAQEEKYMKKANKYFNQSLEYRKQYIDLYDKNEKRMNEIIEKNRR